MTKRFYKEDGTWFIDLKWWPADKSHLAMVMGADKLLDKLSGDNDEVTIEFSTSGSNNYDGVLNKEYRVGGSYFHGAVYHVKNVDLDYSCDKGKNNLWLCGVTLFVFLGRYPQLIYYKVK